MRIDRRRAITSLGVLASGAFHSRLVGDDAGKTCIPCVPIPDECKAGTWKLKYPEPKPTDVPGAAAILTVNFVRGLEWGFAPLLAPPEPPAQWDPKTDCIQNPQKHEMDKASSVQRAQLEFTNTFESMLQKSYIDSLFDRMTEWPSLTRAQQKRLWITLNDHAFIFGSLVVTLRSKDNADATKKLKPRDYLRAQTKLMHAVSSGNCKCFITCKESFGMPSIPDVTIPENKWLDPLPPAPQKNCGGKPSGQIDEECPLC